MVALASTKICELLLFDISITCSQILTKDSVTVFVNAIMYYKVRKYMLCTCDNLGTSLRCYLLQFNCNDSIRVNERLKDIYMITS